MTTNIGYKLFRIDAAGALHALYENSSETVKIGTWIKAEEGPRTENGKVKSRLGELAFRPGWHLNAGAPWVNHIYTIKDGKRYQKRDTVWAEVEYAAGINYQDAAAGYRSGLPYIPEDGYYTFKTNPTQPLPWVITGAMRVNRILTPSEVETLCHDAGLVPLPALPEGE